MEMLNGHVFETLSEVCRLAVERITRYNEVRRHNSRFNLSPRQYLMAQSP